MRKACKAIASPERSNKDLATQGLKFKTPRPSTPTWLANPTLKLSRPLLKDPPSAPLARPLPHKTALNSKLLHWNTLHHSQFAASLEHVP